MAPVVCDELESILRIQTKGTQVRTDILIKTYKQNLTQSAF